MTWEREGFTLRCMGMGDAEELSLADRFAIGFVKAVLVVCTIYISLGMQDSWRYLAVVGLVTYSILRLYFPPKVTAPR